MSGEIDQMTDEQYEEYLQRMQERESQHNDNLSRIDYSDSDKFLADEVNYTYKIITDDVKADVLACLDSLMLKKRTVAKIKSYLITGTTYELVINNFPRDLDINKEKIGFRMVRLWIDNNLSALEAEHNDALYILKTIEVHHRTKLPRSRSGFERGAQKTTIVKSHAINEDDKPEQPKTGISRYVQGRRL